MSDRATVGIAVLVLTAVGLILVAPVLGREGAPRWADAAMASAALAGLSAFVVAGLATMRAARRPPSRTRREEP